MSVQYHIYGLKCVCGVLGSEQSEELGLCWIHCVCVETSFACLKILDMRFVTSLSGKDCIQDSIPWYSRSLY
jgi:hypothetical protein